MDVASKPQQRDLLLAGTSVVIVFALVFALALYSEASIEFAKKMMDWTTSAFTAPVLLFAFLSILFVILLAFSKYGKIKLGNEKPQYSTLSWIFMFILSGIGSSTLYWGFLDWAYYYQTPGLNLTPESHEALKFSVAYSFFHSGLSAWAIYVVPSILADDGDKHLLIAGGIGITPFIPQLEELHNRHTDYELHYAYRSPEHGALVNELSTSLHAQRCYYYVDSEATQLDLQALISRQPAHTHVYVCGPKPLIDAVIACAQQCGYDENHIHWEKFSVELPTDSQSFEVVLAKSGLQIEVPADKTILQVIETHNIEVECLCREGVCGTCETRILEGEAAHLDQYLSDEEKDSQQSMMICVSRAKSARLVLDL